MKAGDALKLAIHGGTPVRRRPISYGRQTITPDDERAVLRALRSDYLTQGPRVAEFETAFAEFVGRRHAVAFANGTAALHGAYNAAGLGKRTELLTTPMTFAATANAALFLGAKAVFADVLPESGLVDPDDLARRITAKTRALCVVHYAGMLADMPKIRRLARRHRLILVEDACHALGARGFGAQAGAFGDLACFSFHPVKPITTGEGGMVVTDSDRMAESLRTFRTHGIVRSVKAKAKHGAWFYEMTGLGFNYRLTDMQCALGLSQLKKYGRFLARRQEIAADYDEFFKDAGAADVCRPGKGTTSAYHLYPMLVDGERFLGGRRAVFEALTAEGIGVQVHYVPVNMHPYYTKLGHRPSDTPNALRFYEREISLPIFPSMTGRDVRDVKTAVAKVFNVLLR